VNATRVTTLLQWSVATNTNITKLPATYLKCWCSYKTQSKDNARHSNPRLILFYHPTLRIKFYTTKRSWLHSSFGLSISRYKKFISFPFSSLTLLKPHIFETIHSQLAAHIICIIKLSISYNKLNIATRNGN